MEVLASSSGSAPSLAAAAELALCKEGGVIGEVSVLLQSRKYVLRKVTKKQVVELGRYELLNL